MTQGSYYHRVVLISYFIHTDVDYDSVRVTTVIFVTWNGKLVKFTSVKKKKNFRPFRVRQVFENVFVYIFFFLMFDQCNVMVFTFRVIE